MPLSARPRADVPGAPASWPAPRQSLAPHRFRLLAPCRITNTSEEVFRMVERGIDFNDPNVYEFKNYQVHHPDQGPLEHRVRRMYLDALTDDIVDMEETNYWFAQPDGGWQNQAERIEALEPAPVPFANPEHTPDENGWETRFELDEIEEGAELVGVVTDLWLYHGIQVDVHCQYDGLIALTQANWEMIGPNVLPGDLLCVRVHKKRKPGLYRWPLQLAVYDKEEAALLMDPDEYVPSINHDWAANNGMSIDDIAKAAGRPYEAQSFFWRQADDEWAEEVNEALGYDIDFVEDEIEPEDEPEWVSTREGRVLDIASSLAAGEM